MNFLEEWGLHKREMEKYFLVEAFNIKYPPLEYNFIWVHGEKDVDKWLLSMLREFFNAPNTLKKRKE